MEPSERESIRRALLGDREAYGALVDAYQGMVFAAALNITGNYADLARSLGAYSERVETPDQIIPAIERGIRKTAEGEPVLLEFITAKEIEFSLP